MKRRGILFLIVTALASASAAGQPGEAGFDFLQMHWSARPAAMAGTFAAVPASVEGVPYNPASLAGISRKETAFSFRDLVLDIKAGYAVYHQPWQGKGHLAAGLAYISYGELNRTSELGESMGTFTPGDLALTLTWAGTYQNRIHYGITAKSIYSRIDSYSAAALAMDLGVLYTVPDQQMALGFSVLNAGLAVDAFIDEKESLPLRFQAGVSKHLAHLPLLINFNILKTPSHDSDLFWGLYWALGGEFTLSDHLFLRWGYHSGGSEQKTGGDSDRLAGVSLGLGVAFQKYRLDYAMESYGGMGVQNTLTLNLAF